MEGFRFDAMLNYHTACVYYRVMECMIPALTSHVHQRLQYAAWRARQCSSLSHNFVLEHFDGESCSEVYEVHGSNKLGKGSYGSVYLATHRLTGDERAVKVMNVDRVTSYYLRKLHTEISILKCVDHPNIIKLQDVFFGKRSVYLVTDLCRGTFTYICTYTYVILLFLPTFLLSYFSTLLLFYNALIHYISKSPEAIRLTDSCQSRQLCLLCILFFQIFNCDKSLVTIIHSELSKLEYKIQF